MRRIYKITKNKTTLKIVDTYNNLSQYKLYLYLSKYYLFDIHEIIPDI